MESHADAFGPIDRPGQGGLKAVAPEAIIDPTAILTSQQGAGSSEDFAHGNPGADIIEPGLHVAPHVRAAQRFFDVAAGFHDRSLASANHWVEVITRLRGAVPARACLSGATRDRNSRRRVRSLRAVADPAHINLGTFARGTAR
jgi:hypothetical protein